MADEKEKILKILMEYVTDKQSVTAAKSALKDIERSIDGTKDRLKGLTDALDKDLAKGASNAAGKMEALDKAGMALEKTGRLLGGTWGDALATIGGGIGDVTAALESLKGAKALLGGAGAGGGGAGAGAGGLLFGAGGITAAGALAAGVAGAGIGAIGYEGLRAAGIAKGASLGQFASVGAYMAGNVLSGGDRSTADAWFRTVAEFTGAMKKATPEVTNFTEKIKVVPDINDIKYAAVQSNREVSLPTGGMRVTSLSGARRNAQLQNLKDIEKAEQASEDERTKIIRAAKFEAEQAEKEYNLARKQAQEKFNQEAAQAQALHDTQMQRMTEDQDRALTQLAQNRDAIGYLQQWEAGRTQQARAEEDFSVQQDQRQEQFDLELAQEKEQFKLQQDQRQQAADRQLEDLKIQLDRETAAKKEAYSQSLSHANDFVNNMRSLFSQLSYGNSLTSQINKQIGQTLG